MLKLQVTNSGLATSIKQIFHLRDEIAEISERMWGVKWGIKSVDDFPRVFGNIDEFWEKIPSEFRASVKYAFVEGTAKLKYAEKDMILYRHISKEGNPLSYWMTDIILPPNEARVKLALPLNNDATWISEILIKKGTPYVEGGVMNQVGNKGFGDYATGGGKQYYFLDETINDADLVELVKPIFLNQVR